MKLIPFTAPAPALAALLLALPTAAHADRVIDDFATPLSGVLMVGSSSGNPFTFDEETQTNVGSTIGGQRYTHIVESTGQNSLVAAGIGGNSLGYSTASGPSGVLTLQYGGSFFLNANLSGDDAFEFMIDGDMDDGAVDRPVQLTITVHSGGTAQQQQYTTQIVDDGLYTIDFSEFDGINFSDVDFLSFEFDASQVSSIDFTLSDLGTVSNTYSRGGYR
ncbi:hypothetical protein [Haliangium sp.]|uniref:hypothetical protein n=1 Tax=Haliangium sp. TaxID=2663208 RepID=UPI003D0C77E2